MNNFIIILTFIYGIAGIISFIGYIPTIKDLLNKKSTANITTYIIWTLTSFTTFLYGVFVINNTMFIIIVSLQLFACLIILILSLKLKIKKGF